MAQGRGVCGICAGNETSAAETQFLGALAAAGATPLYEAWSGAKQPHHVRCAQGHDSYPQPGNVSQGQGICRACSGRAWDAFYVVTSRTALKLGITSGNPRPRLVRHASQGYGTVVRLATGLPGSVAPDIEDAVLAALAAAGERPVLGKEYFTLSCLALVLDITDPLLAESGSRP